MEEVRKFGAHRVVSSRDRAGILKVAISLDFLLVTANVPLDWSAFLGTLRPNGRMHFVGAVLEPIPVGAFNAYLRTEKYFRVADGKPHWNFFDAGFRRPA